MASCLAVSLHVFPKPVLTLSASMICFNSLLVYLLQINDFLPICEPRRLIKLLAHRFDEEINSSCDSSSTSQHRVGIILAYIYNLSDELTSIRKWVLIDCQLSGIECLESAVQELLF